MSFYSKVFESGLLTAYYGLSGRPYPRLRRFLEESQWWDADRLRQFQWTELQRLLQHVFSSVPYYQRKYADAGIKLEDIRTLEDFSRLPPLTRTEVNEHREELRSTAFQRKLLPHATGGSTGQPTRFYITLDSYDWRTASWSRAYSWSGCRLGERTLYLWGAPVGRQSAFRKAKLSVYHWARRELIFSTFSQNPDTWEQIYRAALRFRPAFVIGYVSSIEEFARFLIDTNRKLSGVHSVIAAAEPVYEPTRELVARAFGTPLFNTYGSREFMSIAAECSEHKGLHLNSENLLVQTDSPERTSGEVLVTDLHNYGMPFLRYCIGDAATLETSVRCNCGRGLPLIRSIEGRVLDVIRTRSGRVVPGEVFPHVLKEVPEILEFQVKQETPDELVLHVVLHDSLSPSSEQLIRREVEKHFHSEVKLTIRRTERIERTPSGKRRVIVGFPSGTEPGTLTSSAPL